MNIRDIDIGQRWVSHRNPRDIRIVRFVGIHVVVWERPWSLCAKGATGHKGFVQWARHARLETERRAAS